MKALFSRLNINNDYDGPTPSSSTSSLAQNKKGDKRGRAISSTDKHLNGASLYAEPQDILYPSNAAKENRYLGHGGPLTQPGASERLGISSSKGSKMSSSAERATLGRRGTKTFFESLRGRKPPSTVEHTRFTNGGIRTEHLPPHPSQYEAKDILNNETPVRIVNLRSQSSPAHGLGKVEDVPPPLPPKVHLLESSRSIPQYSKAKVVASHPTERISKDVSPTRSKHKEDNAKHRGALFPASDGPPQSGSHLPEPPLQKTTSKPAPTTSHPTSQQERLSKKAHTNGDDAKSMIRSFSKRSKSNKEMSGSDVDIHQSITSRAGQSQAATGRVPDLATELNELAVAHKEGLLGEEEYRMLRQGVFDKMAGRGEMEVPKEGRFHSMSKQPSGLPMMGEDDSSLFSGSASMQSRASSGARLSSLFRRRSKDKGNCHTESNGLLTTNGSARSGTAPSIRSRMSSTTALESQISQARQARTVKHSTVKNASSSSTMGAPSLLSVDQEGRSLYSATGASISSGNALLGANYAEKSVDEIEAEIAVVEAEGKRILDRFRTLQFSAIGRYNVGYPMLKHALKGLGLEAESEAEMFEDFIMVDGATTKPSQSNGEDESLVGRIRRKRSFHAKTAKSGRKANQGDATFAPSSYKDAARQQTASLMVSASNSLQADEQDDPDIVMLRSELKEIVRRRQQVALRYADRLAFLRSTLRSAKIRQGLL